MDNILIIQGHPDSNPKHFCHALANTYEMGARLAGHNVEIIDLGKIDIPMLRSKTEWESDYNPEFVIQAQKAIERADHLVFIYPLWLGTMPAVLKAWLEQVLRPTFGFDITDKGWKSRLKGRTARIVVTMGMPAIFFRWFYFAHSVKSFERNILKFCGISPVRTSLIGLVEAKKNKNRQKWLYKMKRYGHQAR